MMATNITILPRKLFKAYKELKKEAGLDQLLKLIRPGQKETDIKPGDENYG